MLVIDFPYFGVQAGYACFCGSDYDKHGAADESDCSTACDGNGNQTCGGGWRNSIYEIHGESFIIFPFCPVTIFICNIQRLHTLVLNSAVSAIVVPATINMGLQMKAIAIWFVWVTSTKPVVQDGGILSTKYMV